MPEALTIDGIPDDVYASLVRRAAVAGFAVTDYVRTELIALAGPVRRPTATEFWERVERRVQETGTRLSAEQILRARGRWRRGPATAGVTPGRATTSSHLRVLT